MPSISVIIATRNRPELFSDALQSVLEQDYDELEIIVVNDGSDEIHRTSYEEIHAASAERLQTYWLARRPQGHGQSYSLNFGVAHAHGDYVAFLDDDDRWIDPRHLARVAAVVDDGSRDPSIDLVFSNQAAYVGNDCQPGPIWLEGLASELERAGQSSGHNGEFRVDVTDLMATRGFCHLNTLVVRRDLFEKVGGMDEGIRWECDRDLYLRLIDKAREIRYLPHIVSRHNVPDPNVAESMTTSLSMIERRLYQLRVLDKAALFAEHAEIRRHGLRHKGYALKKIAEDLAAAGRPALALRYAREALGLQPTLKWAGFTLLLAMRAIGQRI
jgi:glycosyltransferase involved in cell wall biosynthesis